MEKHKTAQSNLPLFLHTLNRQMWHPYTKKFSRKSFSLLEKWKAAVDKGTVFGALLTDLPKAFDCLNHEPLVAKLNVYGFTLPALKLVHDYLSDRKQRTRVNNSYSTWFEILFGVPQGSILGPLLFHLYLVHCYLTYFWRIYYSF